MNLGSRIWAGCVVALLVVVVGANASAASASQHWSGARCSATFRAWKRHHPRASAHTRVSVAAGYDKHHGCRFPLPQKVAPPTTPPPTATPPVAAAPAPAEAHTIPPDGTNEWRSDGCHYYVVNQSWHGDYCAAYQADSAGNPIKNIINIYRFDNRDQGNVGPLLYQFETASPEWLIWRVPSDPEYQTVLWSAVPINNVTAEPKIEILFDGHWEWTTVSQLKELVTLWERYVAVEQQQGIVPTTTDIVTIDGASETPQAFTDLVNNVDTLGGNAELGQLGINLYSAGVSDPVDWGICGEDLDYECSPDY